MRIFKLLLLLTISAAASNAQVTRPTPTPTPDEDVVKITTSLIQVDVTVTDSKGRVITDLKPEEIEIYENGKKQTISNFSFVSNVRERTESVPKQDRNAPVIPSGPIKQESVRRTVALVVDDLGLTFESVYWVKRALRKFVDEQMMEGDLVAIIRTAGGIGTLQQFTNDKRMLYAAIERIRWFPIGGGGVTAFAPLQGGLETGEEDEPQAGERTQAGRDREFEDFRRNLFTSGTFGAIGYVVRGMAQLPGRKSVMLFSDGFALFNDDAAGTRDSSTIMGPLRRLIEQANRASVVIYTLDPRGLQVTGLTAADSTAGMNIQQAQAAFQSAISTRGAQLRDSQEGLIFLAEQTGGIPFINNNDLNSGIRKVLDDQSYYLVAYEPDDATFDPAKRGYNRLEVKVSRKGARVRHRSGFFGVSDEAGPPAGGARGDIMYAITSPFATNEIAVRLNAIFGVDKAPKGKDRGAYVRALLHVSADDITFSDTSDGKKLAKFDVLAIGFGDNGTPVDNLSKTYTLTMSKDNYDQIRRRGFVYEVAFPIKKPGGYQLRIALKDDPSGRIGSANQYVDVPDLKKKRLTLSGVGLEGVSQAEWKRRQAAGPDAPVGPDSNPLIDTALRQFKRGSMLNFGLSVLNARPNASLTSLVRLYRDGKEVFAGTPKPLSPAGSDGLASFLSTLSLADKMELGEYVLAIEITDASAKGRYRTARQYVQFDIVE